MDYLKLSIDGLVQKIKLQETTALEVVSFFAKRCEEYRKFNAIIEVYEDIFEKARKIDERIKRGEKLGKLAGIPVIIKDNILYKDKKMSVASALMKDYVCPYSATIIERLEKEDAIIFARANMDEFAMGGSCERSIYGATKNAFDEKRVAGGSSGGSAVAVALRLAPVAIGTDTGGSIRQPSAFNGVVGLKPTYGAVSRYGLVAFASSTDQAGPITYSVEDCEYVFNVLAGKDENDQTSIDYKPHYCQKSKFTIGVVQELEEKIKSCQSQVAYQSAIDSLLSQGHTIKKVSIKHILNSLACYYIITPAEASANLSRFDAIKYASRSKSARTLDDVYVKSRSEGFGKEVKRRIMLGNFVLSSGYYDAYYKKAKRLQDLLRREFIDAFKECDCILTPTTFGEAFEIGGKIDDPIAMYLEDLFTVPASLSGMPAISIPYSKGQHGLPIGVQLTADRCEEEKMLKIAKLLVGGVK